MKYLNYLNIDVINLKNNIKKFKQKHKYKYYVLDVSNNAFSLGMNIIKFLIDIDYLYVNNLNDIYSIRKINKDIPVIFEGLLTKDNILDLINHNVILTINNISTLKILSQENLFANLNIILNINTSGFNSISTKEEIKNIFEVIKNNKKLNLLGIKHDLIKNEDLQEFNYVINEDSLKDLKLYIFNNEFNKTPSKNSNAIKLDSSIYGISSPKNTLFKKIEPEYLQIFGIYSKINQIKKVIKYKKIKYTASIPFGSKNGMREFIKKVVINNNYYNIINIYDLYTLIEVDESINISDTVEITSVNNPLEQYISSKTLFYLKLLNNNLPIIFDNEASYIY